MTSLYYLDQNPLGNQAVVFLHGLGANGSSWFYQFEALKQEPFRLIAPDFPGFGNSRYDGRRWNFHRIAKDVAGLIDELNIAPVYLVGLSMGGVIAQQLVLDYPNLVQKLVLVSTFSVLKPASVSQWFYFLQRIMVVHTMGLATQAKIVARRIFPDPDQQQLREMAETQISQADPKAYRAAMRSLSMFDSRKRLREITSPTLVLSGANDSTVAPSRQKLLADGILGSKHVIIPGAGHAVAIDHHEMFNQYLLEFIKG